MTGKSERLVFWVIGAIGSAIVAYLLFGQKASAQTVDQWGRPLPAEAGGTSITVGGTGSGGIGGFFDWLASIPAGIFDSIAGTGTVPATPGGAMPNVPGGAPTALGGSPVTSPGGIPPHPGIVIPVPAGTVSLSGTPIIGITGSGLHGIAPAPSRGTAPPPGSGFAAPETSSASPYEEMMTQTNQGGG